MSYRNPTEVVLTMSSTYSRTQKELNKCFELCRNPVRPAFQMVRDIGNGVLSLSDAELTLKELPAIIRFLQTKQALRDIHSLLLCRAPVEHRKKMRANSGDSDLHSAFALEQGKLARAVTSFIARSLGLVTVTIDSIILTPEFIKRLSQALIDTSSNIRNFSIINCQIGDSGLHDLHPGLAKLRAQCMRFESCRLSDDSVPYICSIVKAQAALMDAMYWNSTLRNYSACDHMDTVSPDDENEFYSVHHTGLVALSLESNCLSDRGVEALARVLRKNQWILGINLRGNTISDSGVDSMCRALTSNSQCVLQALLLSGGADETKLTDAAQLRVSALLEKTASHRGRIDFLPADTRAVLLTWIRSQESKSISSNFPETNSMLQSEGVVSSCGHSMDDQKGSELLSDDSRDDNAFEFDFVGPPDFPETVDNSSEGGIFITAIASERPPSRISMRPRRYDNVVEHTPSVDYLHPVTNLKTSQRDCQDVFLVDSDSKLSRSRSLSVALALNDRSSQKKNTIIALQPRPRSMSNLHRDRHAGSCSRIGSENKSRRRCGKSKCLKSRTLMDSTVASRASTYSFSPQPDRVVHQPDGYSVPPSIMRDEVNRLDAEGDKIRLRQKVECPKCVARMSDGRKVCHTEKSSRRKTSVIKSKRAPLIKGASTSLRGPAASGEVGRKRSSQWVDRKANGNVIPVQDGVSDAMLTISGNLREVSEHLHAVATALTESLSLSASLRNSGISQTPLLSSTDKCRRTPSWISPLADLTTEGRKNDDTKRTSFDTDMLLSPWEEDDSTLNEIIYDSEVLRKNISPGAFPPEFEDAMPDAMVSTSERRSDAENISDMIKCSIRKKLTDLFST